MNSLPKPSLLTLAAGLSLCILAFFLGLAMLLAQLVGGVFSAGPAQFFLDSLLWMAYGLPVYIGVAAWLILKRELKSGTLFVYVSSLLPFMVLAFIVRFVADPHFWLDSRPGLGMLGYGGVLALFIVLLLCLTMLVALLRFRLFSDLSARPKPALPAERPVQGKTRVSGVGSTTAFNPADIPPVPILTALEAESRETVPDELMDGVPAGNAPSEGSPAGMDSSDEVIPLIFHKQVPKSAIATAAPETDRLPAQTGDTAIMDFSPAGTAEVSAAADPASSGEYWDMPDAESYAESDAEPVSAAALDNTTALEASRSAPLLSKVETFNDGTHTESVRLAADANRVVPTAMLADEQEKKNKVRLVKNHSESSSRSGGLDIPVISVPPEYLAAKRHTPIAAYSIPTEELLTNYPDGQYWIVDEKTTRAAEVLKETLAEFNIEAEVTGIRKGPVITMFEILPAPGVRLSKIANLGDNIALRLAASSVRIVAPIPGKHAVGIEVPNEKRAIVSFKEIVETETFKSHRTGVPVVLGKDITGDVQVVDLTQTPHLLIAGATGSGKSVCVNSIILSILYRCSFNEVKLLLIDPKVVELKLYNGIPHLLTPVITEPKRAFQALQYCICEMERRYSLLDAMGVRDIRSYNRKIIDKNMVAEKLPYIVVIIDEFADLMATTGKELESTLARLAAMSRAVGIHLVLATQRPSVDVITGLIKANIPSRIAFMVAGKFDSRIIIDMVGAEKLLGKGDMLYSSATDAFPVRMQGAFVSDEEVERVVDYVKTLGEPDYIDEEIFIDEEDDEGPTLFDDEDDDPLYEKALEIVLSQGKASASYLQRKLKIGYNRAARLVELMEEKGIVGPMQGSKPRDVMRNPDYGGTRQPHPKARYVPDFSEDAPLAASDTAAEDENGELAG